MSSIFSPCLSVDVAAAVNSSVVADTRAVDGAPVSSSSSAGNTLWTDHNFSVTVKITHLLSFSPLLSPGIVGSSSPFTQQSPSQIVSQTVEVANLLRGCALSPSRQQVSEHLQRFHSAMAVTLQRELRSDLRRELCRDLQQRHHGDGGRLDLQIRICKVAKQGVF